jgi:uncharacterized membrane protein (DUF373 family)
MASSALQTRTGGWRARLAESLGRWRLKTFYEQFEQLVVVGLGLIIAAIVLIALLAMSRKFVILDPESTPAATIAALAAVTVGLGVVYWFLREEETRRR